jgi:thiamine-phosphate pyrophosphorylase
MTWRRIACSHWSATVPPIDVSFYVIVDHGIEDRFSPEDFTGQVIEGGATCLQVRCKRESTRSFMDFASRVMSAVEPEGVPVIINDRLDIALALGAAGVHLGADDMPVADARRVGGAGLVIGASVQDVRAAAKAARDGADYLGVGAIYPTPTKPDRRPISLDMLRAIRVEIDLPIVAIGGITADNASVPLENGADGVAVISALRQCLIPREAALRLRQAVDRAKKR